MPARRARKHLMPSTRSRSPATRTTARSPSRARTGAVAARDATLAACSKPIDKTIRTDPSDADGCERAARLLRRRTKAEDDSGKAAAAKKTAKRTIGHGAAKVVPRISASKRAASDPSATKPSRAKSSRPKSSSSKSSQSKPSTSRTMATNKRARAKATRTKASAEDATDTAPTMPNESSASPEPSRDAEADATVVVEAEAEVTEVADPDDATDAPRRRGPSGVTRTAVDRLDDPPPESGVPLIDNVSRAVEREITQIAVIVGGHHLKQAQRSEAERRARTLASLARTLAELRKLRSDEDRKRARDDDAIPRDLDELRRALSRRLDQMVEGAAGLPAAGDE
ncbi:hypothetical protein [Rhodopseudomonas telluris]|uniref:Uncharacterized protein n=1 Tax=Rhodopseudomonas telluris TaxID=644215 RepID=A0ABV6ESS1_9BRAD